MDLLQYRRAWSGAGIALGFSLLVAWMVPPTDPRPLAPNWRANFRPAAPPAPTDFAGFSPYMASMRPTPVQQYADVGEQTASAAVVVYRADPSEDYATPVSYAPADQDDATSPPVSGYGHRGIEEAVPEEPAWDDRGRDEDPQAVADDGAPY